MKITLNDSIPEAQRPRVESAVQKRAGACEIIWSSSRFPRLVMLVEPETKYEPNPDGGSFFDAAPSEEENFATLSKSLEEAIKACLASGIST